MSTNNVGSGMKTVKLAVKPAELGILAITPMASGEAGAGARAKKVGPTQCIYFCGGPQVHQVTVEDGDKKQTFKQTFEQFPRVYLSDMESICEFETEQSVVEAWRSGELETSISDEEKIGPAWKFLQAMKQSKDGFFHSYSDYLQKVADQLMQQNGGDAIQVACGKAKGKDISFHIPIPEDEDFDICKLHFLANDDWWDGRYDFIVDCGYIFESFDVLLTMAEYDGRIYPIDSDVFFRTWHPMESKLLDSNWEEI